MKLKRDALFEVNTRKRRKTLSSTVVTSPEATTALLETEITGVASSSTVVTTPASQSIGTETE